MKTRLNVETLERRDVPAGLPPINLPNLAVVSVPLADPSQPPPMIFPGSGSQVVYSFIVGAEPTGSPAFAFVDQVFLVRAQGSGPLYNAFQFHLWADTDDGYREVATTQSDWRGVVTFSMNAPVMIRQGQFTHFDVTADFSYQFVGRPTFALQMAQVTTTDLAGNYVPSYTSQYYGDPTYFLLYTPPPVQPAPVRSVPHVAKQSVVNMTPAKLFGAPAPKISAAAIDAAFGGFFQKAKAKG